MHTNLSRPVRVAFVTLVMLVANLSLVVAQSQGNIPLRPLFRTVDMNIGETTKVGLHDGSVADVALLAVDRTTDTVFDAVRQVAVTVRVNGEKRTIYSGNYHLPVTAGKVQIDCPITLDYMERTSQDSWALEKHARLRLWPAGSPYAWPGTFVYPVSQKWLASFTQYSNEPVVDSSPPDKKKKIYYHSGIDLGGAEDMVEVFAATDGIVVSLKGENLKGIPADAPIAPRYDVVYLRDDRGWYYRYSHFDSIIPELKLGQHILSGTKLGMLGKEGGSGGWTHLHFEAKSKQPSGKWGTEDSYVFLWEAYRRQFDPDVLAVARPHKVIIKGEATTLSAGNSWARNDIASYEWTLSDGSKKTGKDIERKYDAPGTYSEILKVTDSDGNYDYDFAVVKVYPGGKEANALPDIHATFYPTMDIKAGDKVFFQVRSRWNTDGFDVWNFADGSDPVTVKSNIETDNHAAVGYSVTSHRFQKPGDYLVNVQRKTERGISTARLFVKVLPR